MIVPTLLTMSDIFHSPFAVFLLIVLSFELFRLYQHPIWAIIPYHIIVWIFISFNPIIFSVEIGFFHFTPFSRLLNIQLLLFIIIIYNNNIILKIIIMVRLKKYTRKLSEMLIKNLKTEYFENMILNDAQSRMWTNWNFLLTFQYDIPRNSK